MAENIEHEQRSIAFSTKQDRDFMVSVHDGEMSVTNVRTGESWVFNPTGSVVFTSVGDSCVVDDPKSFNGTIEIVEE